MNSPLPRTRPLFRVAADLSIGALLALTGLYTYQSAQEEYHFSRLVHTAMGLRADQDNTMPHTDANALRIMAKVHAVLNGRRAQIADVGHPKPGVFWSSDEHLSEPSGKCASYTQVFAKALQTAGFRIRKVGLSKGSQHGIHHILETYVDGRWVVMDALSNLAFRRPDGHLASAAEVHLNWDYYRRQTPPAYNPDYDYSTFYYTNWGRIPVVGGVVHAIPALHGWLEANGVSLRLLFLNVNQWFAGVSLAGAALLAALRVWPKIRAWRAKRREAGRAISAPASFCGNGNASNDGDLLIAAPAGTSRNLERTKMVHTQF